LASRKNKSSRRSRSSSERSGKQPDTSGLPPFFLDANVDGDDLASALRSLGLDIKRSRDEFAREALDVDWLPQVGSRGWVLISADRRQSRKSDELAALKQARVRAFYFSTGTMTATMQIHAFRKGLGQIVRAVRKQTPPFVKIIRPSGAVKPLV
jgi:PIN like domain